MWDSYSWCNVHYDKFNTGVSYTSQLLKGKVFPNQGKLFYSFNCISVWDDGYLNLW